MRHPTRSLIIGGMIILSALGFLIYQGLSNNLVYYTTPSEFLAKQEPSGGSYRLGGQVRPGSVHWHARSRSLTFVLQDPKAAIRVVSQGSPPVMFRAGAGVVVEGTYANHRFDATNLMIKHGNTYRVPKPGQTPVPDSFDSSSK
jgi:cytochrome c-type biogenesis protein CcmE